MARGTSAVVYETNSSDPAAVPVTYSYCALSTGKSHVLATPDDPAVNQVGFLSEIQVAGNYLAFVETVADDETPIPNPTTTEIVNVLTGKKIVVPQPTIPQGTFFPGAAQNLRLSPSGVLAATGTSYSNASHDGLQPEAEYVLGYQSTTGISAILAIAAPDAIAHLAIYACSAGCSTSTTAIIGWTNNGAAQYASPAG